MTCSKMRLTRQSTGFFFLFLCVQTVFCNVEKTIFLGPPSVQVPLQSPTLEDLRLHVLRPENSSLRTQLQAEFPTDGSAYGKVSWFLLEGLREGQRYEVRVCWAATQPTAFQISTYTLAKVFETPELITSLAHYSEARLKELVTSGIHDPASAKKSEKKGDASRSVLFLEIFAAADYFTMNRILMENVPPVLVTITLDPYLLNVIPRSLVPTAIYIVILAISSWFLATYVSNWLQKVARDDREKKDA